MFPVIHFNKITLVFMKLFNLLTSFISLLTSVIPEPITFLHRVFSSSFTRIFLRPVLKLGKPSLNNSFINDSFIDFYIEFINIFGFLNVKIDTNPN